MNNSGNILASFLGRERTNHLSETVFECEALQLRRTSISKTDRYWFLHDQTCCNLTASIPSGIASLPSQPPASRCGLATPIGIRWHSRRLDIGSWRWSATLAKKLFTQYIANRNDLQLTSESVQSPEELPYIACGPLVRRYADRYRVDLLKKWREQVRQFVRRRNASVLCSRTKQGLGSEFVPDHNHCVRLRHERWNTIPPHYCRAQLAINGRKHDCGHEQQLTVLLLQCRLRAIPSPGRL